MGGAGAGMRNKSLFPLLFFLVVLQITHLGCSWLDWQFPPPQRGQSSFKYKTKLCVAGLCGGFSRALTNLEMSINFHYQTVLKD